jgi:ribonuclease E
VELKSGGSIVIEQTEALVAIDVNSGRYRQHENAEKTAFKLNLEAANDIGRQLRLRDLGGLIVCDFIDMRYEKNRREVEKAFRMAVKEDRARIKILRMSQFGVIEMTRQRMRQSLQSSTYFECPHCGGAGVLKSYESVAIELVRLLNLTAGKKDIKRIELTVAPDVASYIQNEKRAVIAQLEHDSEKKIIIKANPAYLGERSDLTCFNEQGSVVKF